MDSKAFIGNSSIHKVRVANSRESQLLKTRLKTLDSQKRFTMTQTNFLIRKTCIKLDKMRSMLKDPGNGKKQTDKKPDEIKGKNDKKITNIEGLLRDETILIPSLKRLISFAMEKSMDIKDEGNDSDKKLEDNFKQDNSTHEPNTNQELDCCEVAPKAVEDEKDQISDNLQPLIELRELTTLVESMYGSEEGEFSSDKIVKCLLPILSGTNLNTEDTADESNKMLLLNKILSKEFPEVYREHEQAVLDEMNREKQLWEKLNPRKPIILPPIYQENGMVLMPRIWDADTRTEVPSTITDAEWEELKYCHYLRPPVKRP